MLKAIIFDMNGVIIDSEPQQAEAALHVFRNHGADTDYAYCAGFIGSSAAEMVQDAIAQFGISTPPEELLEEINLEKKKVIKEKGYIILPGVKELIRNLYHQGIRLAVTSSSSLSEMESMARTLGIKKYFTKLISCSHIEQPKPAPDTFLLALKELGANAKEAMVVEDCCSGTQAAKKAGITCVGFVNPNSGQQDLSAADVLLESFESVDYRFFQNVHTRSTGKPITIADTKRLIIREMSTSDVPNMYEIYRNPEVRKFIPEIDEYLAVEVEKQAAYIRNVYSFYGYGIWGVFSKTSKHLIGRCGIENLMIDGKEEISLSYLLDSKHWGYGYALECCNAVFDYARTELNIPRIVAVIDKENARSIQTAKNLNMTLEKEINYKGRDSLLYSIDLTKNEKQ